MKRILTIALSLLAFAATASAQSHQNVAKGFQADKTYEVGQLDAINLFNGNLNLTIPIGQTYVVSPTLSYSFRLVYSGNNWNMESFEHKYWEIPPPPHPPVEHTVVRHAWFPGEAPEALSSADPVWRSDNAGLGWRISLGRLAAPTDVPMNVWGGGTYHSPDGGRHVFSPVLHDAEETTAPNPSVGYTNDGSYLRLRRLESGTYEIDFPDGNVHSFDAKGTLTRMRDAFGNAVELSLTRDPQTNIATWTVSDPYRSHTFTFDNIVISSHSKIPILKSARLAAFGGGAPATYEFRYAGGDQAVPISRRWGGGRKTIPDCSAEITPMVRVALLEQVVQPDASTYDFAYDRGDEGANFSDPAGGTSPFVDSAFPDRICNRTPGFSGTLKSMKLPARGTLAWTYRLWAFPAETGKKAQGCGQPPPPPPQLSPCTSEGGYDEAVGVETRIERDRDDSILSKRTYDSTTDSTPVDWKTQITTVTSYSSESAVEQKTLHYYSVDGKDTSPKGRTQGHYGLPYSREADLDPRTAKRVANPGPANASVTGFLSTKTYDAADNLLSYTYVRYEGDDATFEAGDESNRRLQTQINVDVVNGATTWTRTSHTDFDGLGHYRETETTGSVSGDPVRRTTTNYNPNAGTYPGTFVVPPFYWVLNTYTSTKVEESRNGDTDTGLASYCFDAATGFLRRTRTIRGTAAGRTDLLTVFTPKTVNGASTGLVEKESHYGGDAPIPGAMDTRLAQDFQTCTGTPGTPAFEISHKYTFGVRTESQYSGSSFKTLDVTVDQSTGLVSESRDALSSRKSTFNYDAMGRILELRPPAQAWTKYEYDLSNAKVVARQYAAGTTTNPLTESHFYYDGLGRLVQQKSRMPQGWTTTGHSYDWLARKKSSYVAREFAASSDRAASVDAAVTAFAYDALGRLRTTTSPDDSKVVQEYPTSRTKARKVKIATEANPAGEEVTTTETYDVFGRLVRVEEPSGANGAQETTDYDYDAGNKLREVVAGVQTRTFSYDGAGLLTAEDHPETVQTTYLYDARGHVTKKCIGGCSDPAVALEYTYDKAERLTTVYDRKAAKTLKSLTYDVTEPGRLATQSRHNHFANETYIVKDTLTYEAATGRPAKKVTDITIDPPDGARPPLKFTHDYDYTDLGAPEHVIYPTCATCGGVAGNARNLALQYQYGHLTGIAGVTAPLQDPPGLPAGTAITYTPAGAVERVQHAKANGDPGVTDIFQRDPDGMARVASIRFDQARECAVIASGPDDQTVTSGDDVTLTVSVPAGAIVEWFEGAPGDTSRPVGTGVSLLLENVTEEAFYWCRARATTDGCEDRSRMATITVEVDLCSTQSVTIDAFPAKVAEGQPFQLRASAGPAETTYTWRRVTEILATTTTPAYDITAGISQQTRYSVVMQSGTCTVTSSELVMTPCLMKRPVAIVAANENTTATLSVVDDQSGVTYQWYEGNSHQDLSRPRGTGPVISVPITGTTHFWVRMTRNCDGVMVTLDSDIASVSFECLPKIFMHPVPASAAGSVSATVTAGGQGPFHCQWFERQSDGTNVPLTQKMLLQAAESTFTWTHASGEPYSKLVFAEIWQGAHGPVPSDAVTLSVSPTPQRIASSSPELTLLQPTQWTTLSVTMDPPPGPTHEYTYEWFMDDGTRKGARTGDTMAQKAVSSAAATYWVVITGVHGRNTSLEHRQVTVSPRMVVMRSASCDLMPLRIEQSAHHICTGSGLTSSPLVTFRAYQDVRDVTYQWYAGQTGDTRVALEATPGKPYECQVSGGSVQKLWVRATYECGQHVDSPTLLITRGECEPLIIDQQLAPVEAEWGGDADVVFEPLDHPGTQYLWYEEGQSGAADTWISQATGPTLHLQNVTKSARYWVHVRDRNCTNSGSNTFPTLVRVGSASGLTPPAWATEVWRDSDSTQGTTLSATTAGAVRYQWFQGPILDRSRVVADSAQSAYTTPNLTADTQYWVRVYGAGGQFLDSPTITVKVCNPPKLTAQQQAMLVLNHEIVAGQQTIFDVPITEPPTGSRFTYRWYRLDGTTLQPLAETGTRLVVRPQTTTQYRFVASTICGVNGAARNLEPPLTFTATVCATPVITTPAAAAPARIFPGSSSTLSVTASVNPAGPLTYQWYTGAPSNTSAPVAGGTTPSITVSPTADTTYWVRITRGACSIDSAAVTVSICSYPQNVTLPATMNIAYGQTATLQFPIAYPLNESKFIRWYKGAVGDTSTLVHYAASAPSLNYTTPALTATTQYWLEYEHRGCVTRSNTVTVNVCKPTITAQPTGTTIASGSSATLSVGTTPIAGQTFRWYAGAVGNTSNPVVNGTTASITVAPTATASYWVRVQGTCAAGEVVDSAAATVTVCNPPVISAVSPTQSIRSGTQTAVSVTATGSNLTYQWYVGTSGTTTSPINNATAYLHYVTPTANTSYWCRVTAENFCSVNSPAMAVNVCTPPTITQQPAAQPSRIFAGASSTLSVAASGSVTYQWYRGTPGNTSSPVAGGTAASITVSPTVETSYWVRVTTSVCTTDSAAVTVSMCTYPQSVSLPASMNIAYGQTATLQFPATYPLNESKFIRWYKGAAGDTSTLVHYAASAPSLNYTTPALTATTQYWLEYEHLGCVTRSNTVTVNVCKPAITTQPTGSTIASGSSATLSVGTTPIAGQTFRWYAGAVGNTSNPVVNGTSASIAVAPTSTTSYWVRVKGTCVPDEVVDSAAATVTVCNPPVISAVSPTQSIRSGTQTAVSVTATGSNLTYQWYVGTSGTTTSPINNATAYLHYVTPTANTNYWCRVTSENFCSVNSPTMTVNVCTPPTITQQPAAQPPRIFGGSSSTLSVAASGSVTYQWYVGTTGQTGSPVPGGTTASITVTPTAATSYWVRVTTSVCTTDSAAVTVSMCTYSPTVTLPATRDIASGEGTTLAFPLMSPLNEPKNIRWYRGPAGVRTNLVRSATGVTGLDHATGPLTQDTQFWVEFDHNGCLTTSTATTVRVCRPTITAHPQSATILSGNPHTLTVGTTGAPLAYQWYIGDSGNTTQPIGGQTSASLTITPAATTTYWVRVTGCGVSVDSAAATVTVCVAPAITRVYAAGEYGIGRPGSVVVEATGVNLTYQWYKGQSGDTSQPIAGAVAATYNFTTQTSQYYWVRVTTPCNNASVNSNAVLYGVEPKITVQPASVTIPRNTRTTLSVTATGTYLSYQWYQGSSTLLAGATSPTYTTPVLSSGVTDYWCQVKSANITKNTLVARVSLCDGPTILSFSTTYSAPPTYRLTVAIHSSQYSLVDYHWYQGVPGDPAQSTYLGEALSQQYFNVTTPTTYWVRVAYKDGSCYSDTAGKTLP